MSSPGWSIKLYDAADEVVWAIKLNALWIVFTLLGGVTLGVGPATLAAYSVARRRSFGESFHALPAFRAAFRREFTRGSLVVLPLVAAAVVLIGNYLFFASLGASASIPRLVSLVALAYASPPDALWESGIYDDADLDDVVLDVVTLTAIPAPGVVLRDYPRDALETLPVGKPRQVSLVLLDSFESRAPPLR